MNKYKVSIIVPYYKGEKTIFNTLNSVFKSASITKAINIEPIVIIDSMEDKSYIEKKLKDVYKDKLIVLSNEENIGVARSRNKANNISTGDYIVFLDQDDTLGYNYFVKALRKMKENPDIIITNGYICNTINDKRAPLYYVPPRLKRKTLLRANKISTPGQVIMSKKVACMENLFTGCSEDFKGADDWAAYVNMYIKIPNLKVAYIHDKVFNYNLHGNNYSNNWEELNNSAIETSKYFLNKVNKYEKIILKHRIDILSFENKFKAISKKEKCRMKNIIGLIKYITFHLVYINRIIGCAHKKLIGFYK